MTEQAVIPTVGIPTVVSIYHPADYLELEKQTLAFMDFNLTKAKGGITHQLLCGHIIDFILHQGIEAIKGWPRYREEYLNDLIAKCHKKGIRLFNLDSKSINLNPKKMKILSDNSSVLQPEDPFDKAANIFSSSNYAMFHKLPFNRGINYRHVTDLCQSIDENGVLSYPLMIYTDVIDGTFKYWIIDGQHRFEAFKRKGLPIRFTLYQKQSPEPITLQDIVRLVARVNNTSKKWGIHQYLYAWKSINVEEYQIISDVYDKTKIPVNTLLQAFSGQKRKKATTLFMEGEYQMLDRKNGFTYVKYLVALKGLISKSTAIQSALLDLFRETPDYNNDLLVSKLTKVKNSWVFPETTEEILVDLKKIYYEKAA